MKRVFKRYALLAATTAAFALSSPAQIRTFPGYDTTSLGHIDDTPSAGPTGLGFAVSFFGTNTSQAWVNNNGNITFGGAFEAFVPGPLGSLGVPIIAPFYADVDTSAADSGVVTFGTGIVDGRPAFAANYLAVAPFAELPIYNTFQVVLIGRADTGAGNFDIEFNYGPINWEGGQATGSNEFGLGGIAARAGLSGGMPTMTIELAGSGVNGALVDTNPFTGLLYSHAGVDFEVRNGVARALAPANAVPEPSTYGLLAALMLLAVVATRRIRAQGGQR